MVNWIDILWLLFCSGLVFLMQAGFLGLETGFTRSKNNINIALKNIVDFAISALIFLIFGYSLMFGQPFAGSASFLESPFTAAFFIFQVMFCGTTVTIISGSIAERTKFSSYIYITILMTALIYPVVGRWIWLGAAGGESIGWLQQLGFIDFAGSTVVHSVGGWAALALVLIIGPRNGRFTADGSVRRFSGANIPFAGLGLLLLFIGWMGFNGGSVFALNEQTLLVIINTLVAGSAGLVSASLASYLQSGQVTVNSVINGILAGLVSITAGAHAVGVLTAVLIGAIGGLVMLGMTRLLDYNQIDDPVYAIPVHLGGGVWGTLAVGLFGNLAILGTANGRLAQVGVQLLGIAVVSAWTFVLFYAIFRLVNRYQPLRVSAEAEQKGLNIAEHGASTDLARLFQTLESQAATNDLSLRAPADPFTDVGQIAARYNEVLDSLQEAERSLDVVVNNSPIILFAVNKEGIFTVSQGKGLEKLGREPREIVGRSIFDVYKGYPNILQSITDALNGQSARLNVSLGQIAYDALYEPIWHDGEVVGAVGIAHDITERVEMEEELVAAHEKAQAANRFKSDLLAKVSHELRTPLGIIMAYGEMLQHGIYGEMTGEQQEKSALIVKNAEHLTDMVNDLLDQAQLEAGSMQLHPEKIVLRNVFDDVRIQMLILAEQKGLQLAYTYDDSLPEIIFEDKVRLRQMLFNLLGNAVKFTETGLVSLNVYRICPDTWAFDVKDSGPGIPEKSINKILEPFKQLEQQLTAKKKGSGLGLAITSGLIEIMGGTLTIQSEMGVGSTFTVVLPLKVETE